MNKLTVIVDGGFLSISRAFIHEKGFAINNSDTQKNAAAVAFQETMAQTFTKILNQFPMADNIVLMSEGGSWRKHLPIPQQLADITYKGNRERKTDTDWDAIFKAYGKFAAKAKELGVTVSQHWAIEGDDWAWYWSRRLNAEGTNVIIWTSDCDLKQLVQTTGGAFTAWFNDKAGLVLPQTCDWPEDPIEAMLHPPFQSDILAQLLRKNRKVTYINPDQIVINKVLCGDAGDNIMAVVRYKKDTRTYRFSAKDYDKIINDLEINTLQDLYDKKAQIADWITSQDKFKPYAFKKSDIIEMLEYNIKLVLLHESVMPDTVTNAMVQVEYSMAPVQDMKLNYRLLCEQNNDIENIFEGAR